MFYPCACSIAADAVQGAAGDLRFPVPAFLALLAIADWLSCVKGVHSGQMVLKVVEAIGEISYLAGIVMLIFGMGLYGLLISNASTDVPSESDRALRGSSLLGMFPSKVTSVFRLKPFLRVYFS
ncbi:hypothetical protein SETIT_2G415700v2 [Setaria italica]|uniref:Uncharacterized protein n=1 Tax=Setaria italica TaxID=4555 RepID=A0A368Q8H9_SETIT|nr:hypothetical protein SETIT_2G415700v2 [Setaria italica]